MKGRRDHKKYAVFGVAILAIAPILAICLPHFSELEAWILTAVSTGILAVVAHVLFGFRKDRHFLRKVCARLAIIAFTVTAIILFLTGCFVGFNDGSNSKFYIVPALLVAVLAFEIIRYALLSSIVKDRKVLVFPYLALIVFKFVAIFILRNNPQEFVAVVIAEVLLTYMSIHIGFLPCLIYQILSVLVFYFPFLPLLDRLTLTIIQVGLPSMVLLLVYHQSRIAEQDIARARRINLASFTAPITVILAFFACLSIGVGSYKMIAIASDSMLPSYARGDVVIYYRTAEVNIGDILVFRRGNQVITHRVVEIIREDGYVSYRVKGDNNADVDDYVVFESDVEGVVRISGKYLGYPTVILKQLLGGTNEN